MLHANSGVLLNRHMQPIGWGLIYIFITGTALQHYINWTSPVFLLGVLCLLQVTIPAAGNTSVRFASISMGFGALSVFLPVKTMLYLTCASALLFVLETGYGKVKHAAVLTLLIMSPVFQYAVNVFSFPIRLQLTALAAGLMKYTGQQVRAAGNTLILNGNEFSVDPECMGLNMLETSLLLGIMISCFYQGKLNAKAGLPALLGILSIITALNIFSNLFRIIAIIQFNLLPGTALHDITGLACLLLYVILPGVVVIRAVMKHAGKQLPATAEAYRPAGSTGLYLLVTAVITLTAFNTMKHEKEKHIIFTAPPPVSGYSVERIDADILKLHNPASLVYIKKIKGFYSTEHNPMICWKGSGYLFKSVEQSTIRGNPVYLATLIKGKERLYTAWWYDNAKTRTISQVSWRWDVFKGAAGYSLINVTCSTKSALYGNIQNIYSTSPLNKLL